MRLPSAADTVAIALQPARWSVLAEAVGVCQ
jgi:hypothetical protein